jgi:hypothetical protein
MPGIGVGVDLKTVSDALRKTDKAFANSVRRNLRKAIREEGELTLAAIKTKAAWSTRIPGATSIAVTLGVKTANARIRVDKKKAPHGRPFDRGTSTGKLRHPVFARSGDKSSWAWTTEPTRPFFFVAIGGRDPAITKRFNDVVDQVIQDAIAGRES